HSARRPPPLPPQHATAAAPLQSTPPHVQSHQNPRPPARGPSEKNHPPPYLQAAVSVGGLRCTAPLPADIRLVPSRRSRDCADTQRRPRHHQAHGAWPELLRALNRRAGSRGVVAPLFPNSGAPWRCRVLPRGLGGLSGPLHGVPSPAAARLAPQCDNPPQSALCHARHSVHYPSRVSGRATVGPRGSGSLRSRTTTTPPPDGGQDPHSRAQPGDRARPVNCRARSRVAGTSSVGRRPVAAAQHVLRAQRSVRHVAARSHLPHRKTPPARSRIGGSSPAIGTVWLRHARRPQQGICRPTRTDGSARPGARSPRQRLMPVLASPNSSSHTRPPPLRASNRRRRLQPIPTP